MQRMQIYGVSFDMVGKQPIVLLKTTDGNRFLPIWIGHPEAAAILMKLQGASTPRPMTHDLLADVLEQHRRQVRARLGHRAPRQHLLRDDHAVDRRRRGRDRLPALRRPRPRGPLRRADLRGRGGHRGVLDRVRARGRGPGGGRREVQGLPRRGHPRGLRRRQRRASASQRRVGDGGVAGAMVSRASRSRLGACRRRIRFIYVGGFEDVRRLARRARVDAPVSATLGASPFDTGLRRLGGSRCRPTEARSRFGSGMLPGETSPRRSVGLRRPPSRRGLRRLRGHVDAELASTSTRPADCASDGPRLQGRQERDAHRRSPRTRSPDLRRGLAVSPNGKFLFVGDRHGAREHRTRSRSQPTAAVRPAPGSPTRRPADSASRSCSLRTARRSYAADRDQPGVHPSPTRWPSNGVAHRARPALAYPTGGRNPFGLAVSPNGENLYAALYNDDTIAAFDSAPAAR